MPKQVLKGRVVKHSDKTAMVRVERSKYFPLYEKSVTQFKKFASHDPLNICQEGDWVVIRESRPFSKTKCWEIIECLSPSGYNKECASSHKAKD